ncbi:uncharacterized protein MYCFIDRAFT_206019 [Pseudocercospora fijiensis CIRAD86]|uniref:Uncharacterized protein n=1 Tax=Pseudocercospora fijiensis (strain CIRAD86) TaxID=383855 RepID=N1QBC8_PSEFD|nr:uncharacterized protein MYCFIDRAFT_206019 [Pseudocercospora fijiensis CIRAD86]EME88452.1 hypothetical protein MYCFIDRAFT_206019 [Pseudocercospora fijiensis CIRAD86]
MMRYQPDADRAVVKGRQVNAKESNKSSRSSFVRRNRACLKQVYSAADCIWVEGGYRIRSEGVLVQLNRFWRVGRQTVGPTFNRLGDDGSGDSGTIANIDRMHLRHTAQDAVSWLQDGDGYRERLRHKRMGMRIPDGGSGNVIFLAAEVHKQSLGHCQLANLFTDIKQRKTTRSVSSLSTIYHQPKMPPKTIRGGKIVAQQPQRGNIVKETYNAITDPENRSVVTALAFFVVCDPSTAGKQYSWSEILLPPFEADFATGSKYLAPASRDYDYECTPREGRWTCMIRGCCIPGVNGAEKVSSRETHCHDGRNRESKAERVLLERSFSPVEAKRPFENTTSETLNHDPRCPWLVHSWALSRRLEGTWVEVAKHFYERYITLIYT